MNSQEAALKPKVNAAKAAEDVKRHLNSKKMSLIDYTYENIELFPPPTGKTTPELSAFAKQYCSAFDYAETVTTGDKGEGFPNELMGEYDAKTKEIEAAVNGDTAYWEKLRSEVLPLYRKPGAAEQLKMVDAQLYEMREAPEDAKKQLLAQKKQLEKDIARELYWNDRWKAVKLFYDPIDMDVSTTKIFRNKDGEKQRGEAISKRKLPAGFVIRIL